MKVQVEEREVGHNFPEPVLWKVANTLASALHALASPQKPTLARLHSTPSTEIVLRPLLSPLLIQDEEPEQSGLQALWYMTPERLQDTDDSNKTDIWLLGVILYWLAMNRLPFSSENLDELADGVLGGTVKPMRDRWTPEFQNLVYSCLKADSAARATLEEVLEMINYRKAESTRLTEPRTLNEINQIL
jgi:serine/threonine protein kinase